MSKPWTPWLWPIRKPMIRAAFEFKKLQPFLFHLTYSTLNLSNWFMCSKQILLEGNSGTPCRCVLVPKGLLGIMTGWQFVTWRRSNVSTSVPIAMLSGVSTKWRRDGRDVRRFQSDLICQTSINQWILPISLPNVCSLQGQTPGVSVLDAQQPGHL